MVSNYDRIYREIVNRAEAVAVDHGVEKEALVTLVMEIVNLEDQHRTKSIRIKQLVQDRIQNAALSQSRGVD